MRSPSVLLFRNSLLPRRRFTGASGVFELLEGLCCVGGEVGEPAKDGEDGGEAKMLELEEEERNAAASCSEKAELKEFRGDFEGLGLPPSIEPRGEAVDFKGEAWGCINRGGGSVGTTSDFRRLVKNALREPKFFSGFSFGAPGEA